MSRLTKKLKPAKGKSESGGREIPAVPRPSSTGGVVLDGAVYPLAGEPPVASSRGWGDMSWLRW